MYTAVNSRKPGYYEQGGGYFICVSQKVHCRTQYFSVSFKYRYINLDTISEQPVTEGTCWKKTKTTKYQTTQLVCMELFCTQWALNLPVVFVKNKLPCIQECVKVTKEGKT